MTKGRLTSTRSTKAIRKPSKRDADSPAAIDEFDREGMGIAAKE